MTDAPAAYFTSDAQRARKYHVLHCAKCGAKIWTSSAKGAGFICISCRRALGLAVCERATYTTLSTAPRQVLTIGTCGKCQRRNQPLANGICECCRFYDISDIDPVRSACGRKGRGGRSGY